MVAVNPTVSENAAGKIVRVGTGESAYEAFVPSPLPPQLEMDIEVIARLSEADRAIGELAGLGRTLPNPDLLIGPFVRKEAVLSSKIEGTEATITDVYRFEAGQRPSARRQIPSDVREVVNYINALYYGLDRTETLPVSKRLIREMHEHLMSGVRGRERNPGEFRRSQNWIGRPGCLLNEASYVPPPADELDDVLSTFEAYLHADEDPYPPLVRLAFIHCQFEMIHPFIDGNGRIGRLLMPLLLGSWGLLPLPLLYLSAFFERERDSYYARLQAVSGSGAWRDWVLFFLRGVVEQSRDATIRAKRLQDLQVEWRGAVIRARSSALLVRIVDYLFVNPVFTIPKIAELLDVTYPAAKANIDKLIEAQIVEPWGEEAYGRQYWAPRVLDAIGER